jgi:hypothetical protein
LEIFWRRRSRRYPNSIDSGTLGGAGEGIRAPTSTLARWSGLAAPAAKPRNSS